MTHAIYMAPLASQSRIRRLDAGAIVVVYRLDADYDFPAPDEYPRRPSCMISPHFSYHNEDPATRPFFRVHKGYEWDGCSFKWRLGPIAIGIYDGEPDPVTGKPRTWQASLRHDPWYEFILDLTRHFCGRQAVTLRECWMVQSIGDRLFFETAKADGFADAETYYRWIRRVGWFLIARRYVGGEHP